MEDTKKIKKPLFKKWWFWVIVVVVGIGVIGSMGDDKESEPTGTNQVVSGESEQGKPVKKTGAEKALDGAIEVDYKELHKDYMDNAIGADAKYKDKMLILEGSIDDIDREIAGQPYVTFDVDAFLSNVRIAFDKSEEEKIAELSKGQKVKIVGRCKGTLLSTTVSMTGCYLVE